MIRRINKFDELQLLKLFWEFHKYNKEKLISAEIGQFHEYKNIQSVYKREAKKYANEDGFIVYVADIESNLVGYCSAKVENLPDRILDKQAYIEDWFVLEKYQGQGIGEELFNTLLKELKRIGCTHVKLETFTTNKKAQEIYHRYGFVDEAIIMFKKL